MPFHSEHGQDRWLAEHVFGGRRDGFFVEAGALDGLLHSNTLYFEREMGWRGVLIEPIAQLAEQAMRNRPGATVYPVALAATEREEVFQISSVVGWSGFARVPHERRASRPIWPVKVRTLPLAELLRDVGAPRVDYLSLDLEGAEFEVLAGFPFGEFAIDVLGVEDNGVSELRALMEKNGYRPIGRVGQDDFWRRVP